MNSATIASTADRRTVTGDDRAEARLRLVLRTNATTSGLGGLAALVAGGAVADLLGTDQTVWVRIVGAGLIGFALFVAWISTTSTAVLRKETPLISAGDLAWVAGSAVTVAAGWYSTTGAVVIGAVAAMVGGFGVAQLTLWRRLRA